METVAWLAERIVVVAKVTPVTERRQELNLTLAKTCAFLAVAGMGQIITLTRLTRISVTGSLATRSVISVCAALAVGTLGVVSAVFTHSTALVKSL